MKVKTPEEYCEDLQRSASGLKNANIASCKRFFFISPDVDGTNTLKEYLGDARIFFDMMVAQWPTGELKVLPGRST